MSRPWIANEQWLECERCGVPWPVSELRPQRTEVSTLLRVCWRCFDNTDNNYRDKKIAEILKQTAKQENRDLRNEPRLWFTTTDEMS